MPQKTIYLAGGCFWGLEDLMAKQPGVVDTEVGYSGGENSSPTYQNHPGHAEALKITYDDQLTSYEQLLDYYFRIHDPTTLNQQGNDRGSSYRSAIFYQSQDERKQIEQVIEKVNQSGLYADPVVTSLEPFDKFYSAEDYHQNYLQKNPGGYSCHFLRDKEPILK